MKIRMKMLLLCMMLLVCCVGCGGISNEVITIRRYKRLSIEQANAETEEEKVWEALLEQCEVESYPQDKMESYAEDLKRQYRSAATMYSVSEEELIADDYGMSLEEVVQKKICKEFAVELIAEKEKITVSEQEYTYGLERYATEYGYQDIQAFEEFVGKEHLQNILLQDEVTEFLKKHAKK